MRPEPGAGWQPLRNPRSAGVVTPFTRLVRTHAVAVAGDTLLTLALADSVFFGISPSDARPKVLLYLLLTMAPFALVAPMLGPWIDSTRGGRRLMVIVAAVGRAAVCVVLIDDLDSLLLFPEAFAALVLSKSHAVARSALVPTVVRNEDELVEANSKLALASGLTGFVVAVPALLVLRLGGASWVLGLAVIFFVGAAALGIGIPRTVIAEEPIDELERTELRSTGVLLAASAMGLLRAIVGFFTFFVAFLLRTDDVATWWFGVMIGVSAVGAIAGSAAAPALRRSLQEERMLVGALLGVSIIGSLAVVNQGLGWTAVLSGTIGIAASAGKAAFDAIVQRDAPDANQGRSFARFETRFQLAWVVGAVVPVVIPLPDQVGFLTVTLVAGFAALSYVVGGSDRLLARIRRGPPSLPERKDPA